MASRSCPFEKNKHFRIKQNFSKFSQQFREGQILEFVEETYSRYDNMAVYVFKDISTGQLLSLEIIDAESPEQWWNFFEKIQ